MTRTHQIESLSYTNSILPRDIRERISRKALFGTAIAVSLLLSQTSCKGKGEQSAESGGAASESATAALSSSATDNSILRIVPQNALGFFHWNTTSAGYKKLSQSAWAGGDQLFSGWTMSSAGSSKILDAMKKAGIDPTDRKQVEALLTEGAVFGVPPTAAGKEPELGIVFRSASDQALSQKLLAFKTGLGTESIKTTELKLGVGTGFSFDGAALRDDIQESDLVPPGGSAPIAKPKLPPRPVFVGWNKSVGAVAASQPLLEQLLTATPGEPPAVVKSPQFALATKGLPPTENWIQFGFWSLKDTLKSVTPKITPQDQPLPEDLPLQSVAFVTSMGDVPQNDIRIVTDPTSAEQKQWLSTAGNSPSGKLLAAVPNSPLVFVSLDGQTIRRIKEIAAKTAPGAEAYQPFLAVLDNINRIGIAARMAPVGQSLLPIPDMIVLVESKNAEQTKKAIMELASMGMAMAGGPAGGWQDVQSNGISMKMMQNPTGIGPGVYLATAGDVVLASSSQQQLAASVAGVNAKSSAFAQALPPKAKTMLDGGQDVANLYLNFEEAGTLMENMKDMAGMFAPQSQQTQELFTPENIASVKKLGSLVGTLTVDGEVIAIKSVYQTSAKQVASLK